MTPKPIKLISQVFLLPSRTRVGRMVACGICEGKEIRTSLIERIDWVAGEIETMNALYKLPRN